jgi:tetratricopeptide (TPR) repeat protein
MQRTDLFQCGESLLQHAGLFINQNSIEMKKKYMIVSVILLICITASAQKDEIKAAQSNFDKGKVEEALAILKKVEYMIVNAPTEVKSDFYFLKGNAHKSLATKNIDAAANFSAAAGAYQDVLLYENDSQSFKYAFKANLALKDMKSKLVDGAYSDYKAGKYKESAAKSYEVYLFDKKDTLNLYNAAAASLTGEEYLDAVKYYSELRRINYTGKGVVYYATNKKTKEEDAFTSAVARDSNIREGLYEKPRNVFPPSKKQEILVALAFSLMERNDYVNSEKYYKEALDIDSKCVNCYVNLAYIVQQKGKALMNEMDALGNSAAELQQYEKLNTQKQELVKTAIPYLKQALSLEPKNEDAYKSLLGIYRSLDMTAEYNALKSSK